MMLIALGGLETPKSVNHHHEGTFANIEDQDERNTINFGKL